MKLAPAVVAVSALFALAACASSSGDDGGARSEGTDPTEQDRGLEGEGVGSVASAPDVNPDGVAYPTDNIGTLPRKGAKFGNRIANLKFLGYPDADMSSLQPVSLAQYFDPSGTKYRVIHIQAAGVWCSACQAETETVVTMKAELEAKKAVWLVALVEGTSPGVPSKEKDLKTWISSFKSPYTHVLDPGKAAFGPFFNAGALPWNTNIDATTMEILTAGTGGVVKPEGIIAEIDDALAAADAKKFEIPQ